MLAPQRKIIHIDMDCFFAAVEMRDRPDLKKRPLAVGGRPEGRGVITTCNYKAREFGVRSAISSREALRRCPDLVILPTRFQKYRDVSAQIRQIFHKYSEVIEPLSLDEAYLDVTDGKHFEGSATLTAQAIRQEIESELELTASAGIANNKFLAKVASDWKKPNGQFTIKPDEVAEFVKNLPVKKIPGVGKATMKKLKLQNIETCADLQSLSLEDMTHRHGRFGERLYDLCRGVDHSTVKPHRTRKSISVETTFHNDVSDWVELKKQTHKLFDELKRRMDKSKVQTEQIKSLGVKFKSSEFVISSKERATEFSEQSFVDLVQDLHLEHGEPIRLLGLGCKLKSKEQKKSRSQLALF